MINSFPKLLNATAITLKLLEEERIGYVIHLAATADGKPYPIDPLVGANCVLYFLY